MNTREAPAVSSLVMDFYCRAVKENHEQRDEIFRLWVEIISKEPLWLN